MKKNKAYKYRIYPDHLQKELLAKTFGCVRFIYNKMLTDKIDHFQLTKKSLSNTPAQYKDEYPFLKEVDSLALANAQLNLQTAYSIQELLYPEDQSAWHSQRTTSWQSDQR